jgi:hypothetical protein
MKKDGEKMIFSWKWFGFFIILVLVVWGIWLFIFSYGECRSWECFNSKLENCDRVRFIGGSNMIFEYTVHGVSGGKCRVEVELLQGELNNQDSIKLQGQKMICNLPRRVVMIPESNLGFCHGMLKEGMQDLVIKKLYTYIVQNLGRINLEVMDVPTV